MSMAAKAIRRSAAYIIAFHFGADLTTINEARYQPTKYRVAVYTLGDFYYAAPTRASDLPAGFAWKAIGEQYGRTIFRASPSEEGDTQ